MEKIRKRKRFNTPYTAKEKFNALKLWKNSTIEFVCHRYHCSERSLWRWKALFDGTLASLENKSKRPHTPHPNAQTDEEKKHIFDLVRRNPDIGLNELYGKLRRDYGYKRNPVTLYRFLKRNAFYENKVRNAYKPKKYDTPVHVACKWQLDVKYVPLDCYSGNGPCERYYQYTMIDEATRERFIFAYQEQCADSSVDFVKRAIRYFGYKPREIQTDNGQEFTYPMELRHKKVHTFDMLCKIFGIVHKTIKPRTPRHNGKVERSHRNDNERFYRKLRYYSFDDLQLQMKAYLKRSNNIPISTLGWLTPLEKRAELLRIDFGILDENRSIPLSRSIKLARQR